MISLQTKTHLLHYLWGHLAGHDSTWCVLHWRPTFPFNSFGTQLRNIPLTISPIKQCFSLIWVVWRVRNSYVKYVHSKIVYFSCEACAKILLIFLSYQCFYVICWPQKMPIRWKNHILRFHTIGFCSMCHWLAIVHCWTSYEFCLTVTSPSFIITIRRMTIACNKVCVNNFLEFLH